MIRPPAARKAPRRADERRRGATGGATCAAGSRGGPPWRSRPSPPSRSRTRYAPARLSAREVAAAALARIAAANPSINAFCEVRAADALARADEIDAQVARGEDPGLLAGVPVAIKDVVWEAGIETTNASRALLGFRPQRSAVSVERLAAAGAVFIGRTNQPEFCYRGDCANELYGAYGEPGGPDPDPGRLQRRVGRCGRRRSMPGGHRQRRGRVHQDPLLLLWGRRLEAELRPGAARARLARLVHPEPRRSHHQMRPATPR